jgi:hypothetical protein
MRAQEEAILMVERHGKYIYLRISGVYKKRSLEEISKRIFRGAQKSPPGLLFLNRFSA